MKGGTGETRDDSKLLVWLQAALVIFTFLVFIFSPIIQITDSKYSMLTAESLIQHHTFDLNSYKIPGFDPALPFNTTNNVNAYQLQMTNGHKILYLFPLGTSVLSVPGVAVMNLLGISVATPDGRYNFHGAIVIQKFLAAFLMSILAAVFFRTALLMLNPFWSMILAAGGTFGTEVWSTASRGMWSHTWEILLGAVVAYFLLRNAEDDAPLRPILLATLLSWMFFVRPTGAVPIFFISAYILLFRSRRFVPYALTGALWLVVFMWIWTRTYGTPLAAYYEPGRNTLSVLGIGLYCNLISPSRGVLVYCPVIAFVLYLTIRYWRTMPHRRLAVTSLLTIGVLTPVFAMFPVWWGGLCYGARFFTDALPWFFLLAVLACAAIPEGRRSVQSNLPLAAGILLLLLSVAINGRGATSWATWEWSKIRPLHVRVLDWSQPQFLAGWVREH